MAAPGTYKNPAERDCWETCQACYRCAARGTKAKCVDCSGRFDLLGVTDPDDDDLCRCTEGILQYKPRNAPLIQVRYRTNPFETKVMQKEKLQDETDWDDYVQTLREKFQDEDYDPITFHDI